MITGASQMEGVILVVAANDGIQVQTREHVILAKEIGIPYMVVFLNKIDVFKDTSMLDLIEIEIRDLIESYGFSNNTPVIRGSAKKALAGDEKALENIRFLMQTIDSYFKEPIRAINDSFLMPIESVLVAQGRGTVVTGKIEKGTIKIGTELELLNNKQIFKTICLGLEMFRRTLDYAQVGDNVGVLIRNVPNKEVIRGNILCAPMTMRCYTSFLATAYILSGKEGGRERPFRSGYKPQFFFRVSNVTGTVLLEKEDMIAMPGENIRMTVTLGEKAVLNEGLRFVMREGKLTIGAGIIIKLLAEN